MSIDKSSEAEQKVCPRCQKRFQCHHQQITACSCSRVNLLAHQRRYLAEHYADCLCADCLEAIRDRQLA